MRAFVQGLPKVWAHPSSTREKAVEPVTELRPPESADGYSIEKGEKRKKKPDSAVIGVSLSLLLFLLLLRHA